MLGSVWGVLKYISQLDILNKYRRPQYNSRRVRHGQKDPGSAPAVEKNAVKNYFVETHGLKMHEDKSCLIHVENVKKC